MSASLVGSEMCIRDSPCTSRVGDCRSTRRTGALHPGVTGRHEVAGVVSCLLYTSDAADDM
eukprot:9490346-Alexandrium_andersonii.AAC.1